MFFSRAALKRSAIGFFAGLGMLDGSAESDHKMAWSLFPDQPATERDFLFEVTDRRPLSLEILSARQPVCQHGLWDIRTRPADLGGRKGERFDLRTTLILTRSKCGPDWGRGRKHDIVSAALHDLRAGRPWPEIADLPRDAARGDIVRPVTLAWFWRSADKLGFVPDQGNDNEPMFHAESSPASRTRSDAAKHGAMRAIEVHSRIVVTDEAAFAQTLHSGIGRLKAYGYGMLRVQQISEAICDCNPE
jgi:CRISPR-associated protein Cas6/Cse3/CasE subtype I-E